MSILAYVKLETDEKVLDEKANNSLAKNRLDMVVGNILTTRYKFVIIYMKSGHKKVLSVVEDEGKGGVGLEEKIVKEINEAVGWSEDDK